MSTSPTASPPKRPRLSLAIDLPTSSTINKSITALKGDLDITSPTAFNTLSNAYAAAIESSSPKTARPSPLEPQTAIRTRPTSLKLVTNSDNQHTIFYPSLKTQTPGNITVVYPDTPSTYHVTSPATAHPETRNMDTPIFTFTPPQSAHPSDSDSSEISQNNLSIRKVEVSTSTSPRTPRRRGTTGSQYLEPPYTHPRALHSILRNSPLPPRTSLTPLTPRRMSQRLADKANKKLAFGNPLTQTIVTNQYVKSHIDLLAEEASPYSPSDPEGATMELETLDLTMAYTGDETRDGGQTPGPFEEMRRRMAGLAAESDTEATTPASRKRKRREKKRHWVWTIGTGEDEEDAVTPAPLTAVRSGDINSEKQPSEMLTLLPTVYKAPDAGSEDTEMMDRDRPGSAHSI